MGVVAEVTPPKELRLPTPPSAEVSRFSPELILFTFPPTSLSLSPGPLLAYSEDFTSISKRCLFPSLPRGVPSHPFLPVPLSKL